MLGRRVSVVGTHTVVGFWSFQDNGICNQSYQSSPSNQMPFIYLTTLLPEQQCEMANKLSWRYPTLTEEALITRNTIIAYEHDPENIMDDKNTKALVDDRDGNVGS
ncbi:hypothetical protein OPV22_017120 [Ensete ventricosum]|uniref:Uncharacterized protein n=1 Tax=Ensete ventricosum TaxID=4639 RepID=A0AAV8QYZ7_ENSVE|nr:hypothetical protein OPV22_017120 [Ensete ventricosum]